MKLKQLLAALLCAVLLLCCAPVALAAEDTETVMFWFGNGSELKTAIELTVSDGTAESYGYTVATADHNGLPIETVSAMDVLVAAHAAIYGDAFTKETANDYLVVGGSFITKAFRIETSNLGFTINDATSHDDTFVEAYGGYTGYAIDTARVHDGDRVCLYVYKDAYWSDILPQYDSTSIEAAAGEAFTFSVSGYSVMYYGCGTQETIAKNTKPMEGVTVECTQDFKTFTTVGTVGKDGKLSVTLDKTGTYYLVVRGTFEDSALGEVPLVANICTVTVKEPEPDTSDAKYIPFFVRPVICFKDYKFTFGIRVYYFDLAGKAPVKSEAFTLSVTLYFLQRLFQK